MLAPFHLLWGVDTAIKKLRPTANYQLEGMNFTIWEDPNGTSPPSWDEINSQMNQDKALADQWQQSQEE